MHSNNHLSTYYYLPLFLIFHITFIHCELSINHDSTGANPWMDDFAYDPTGQNGWMISQTLTSGYDLPVSNPIIYINNIPTYHGPFPASYSLSRKLKCNTINDTFLFVLLRASYCNTDKENDLMQLSINDPSETYNDLKQFDSFYLNQKSTLFNRNQLSSVQTTTANYYTNHASSSTNIPQCSQVVTTTLVTTNTPIESHLIPGEWYSYDKYKGMDLTIMGQHTYEIKIDISLSGDQDEYVIISGIMANCIQLIVPTVAPTVDPTTTPTISPTITPTVYTKTPSKTPTVTPTNVPSKTPTETPTSTDISMSAESLEIHSTLSGVIKQSNPKQPWCYHCALYVIIGCIGLVFCFMILMCFACIMYRKEAKKQKEDRKKALNSHMKYKARAIPNFNENNGHVTVEIDNINENTESTKHSIELNEMNEIKEEEKSEIDIESDVNIMRYDEMDPDQQLHPDHKKTFTLSHDKNDDESSDIINEKENENESETENESESESQSENDNYEFQYNDEDDILGINDKIINKRKKDLKIVDNSSYDHLNMDEDIVDKSDSPYF